MPEGAGWRSSSTTDYLDSVERSGFAWEFLRRDPQYRQDFERISVQLSRGTSIEEVVLALAKRWGLKFPV